MNEYQTLNLAIRENPQAITQDDIEKQKKEIEKLILELGKYYDTENYEPIANTAKKGLIALLVGGVSVSAGFLIVYNMAKRS